MHARNFKRLLEASSAMRVSRGRGAQRRGKRLYRVSGRGFLSLLTVILPLLVSHQLAAREKLLALEQITHGLDNTNAWDLAYVHKRCSALYIFTKRRLLNSGDPDAEALSTGVQDMGAYFLSMALTQNRHITGEHEDLSGVTGEVAAFVKQYNSEAIYYWRRFGRAMPKAIRSDYRYCGQLYARSQEAGRAHLTE